MDMSALFARNKYARAVAAGCVALAAGGIVLLREPHGSQAASGGSLTLRPVTVAGQSAPTRVEFAGPALHGRLALAQSAVAAHGTRHVYAEVRVEADQRAAVANESRPVALAVVLDVSGSMSGEKIEQARNAVLELVNSMRDNDRIALVTYSDSARVVQPLARVGDVRHQLRVTIPTIGIEGGTNIPAGLGLGAAALAAADAGLVRRVVLVSDGQDGSGQPLANVTGDVRTRANGGVTLSSLGIGADFDERFMTSVADAGRGNYEALRDGAQLRTFLARELRQATTTTVDRAVAEVALPSGWRLARAFGAEAEGTTGTVRLPIGALFAGDVRRVVLDLEVDARAPGDAGSLSATLAYRAVADARDVTLDAGRLALRAVPTEADAAASRDVAVFADTESTVIAARQVEAVNAWRAGRAREAQALAAQNVAAVDALAAAAPTAQLGGQAAQLRRDQNAINSLRAESEEGRAYGLQSNARHRAAAFRPAAAAY